MQTIIITNIPSPYRVRQFDKLCELVNNDLLVIYYSQTEKNRKWTVPKLQHRNLFLAKNILNKINLYPDVIAVLKKENPEIIIAGGFTPTIILAFLFALVKRKKFVVFTDSWLSSANKLSQIHKLIRRLIIPKAHASICVGVKGREFLLNYGAIKNTIFHSPLAIENDYYSMFRKEMIEKQYDVVFSGQFIHRKMPFFVLEVAKKMAVIKPDFSILLMGSGPLEKSVLQEFDKNRINYYYPGFIQQEELPKYYASAKVLLFPTLDDPWGLVANEACAVGTPVITCQNAGAANDLIIHNVNGYILPTDADIWVKHIKVLLNDLALYEKFSNNALNIVKLYSIELAAQGIKDAIDFCIKDEK